MVRSKIPEDLNRTSPSGRNRRSITPLHILRSSTVRESRNRRYMLLFGFRNRYITCNFQLERGSLQQSIPKRRVARQLRAQFRNFNETRLLLNTSCCRLLSSEREIDQPLNDLYENRRSNGGCLSSTRSEQDILSEKLDISYFKDIDELDKLSAEELKILLTHNQVNCKGVVEKSRLLELATILWIGKNEHNSKNFDNICKICLSAAVDCVILECGHMAMCINCGSKLRKCPICRQHITRLVKTFRV